MLSRAVSNESRKQAVRFLLTGGLNTVVGFVVILGLLALGVDEIPANLCGYGTGLLLSFCVNRRWTFEKRTKPEIRELFLFGLAFASAYSANLIVIIGGQNFGFVRNPFLHLAGVVVYTSVFFILCQTFVYNVQKQPPVVMPTSLLQLRWPELAVMALLFAALGYVLTVKLTHDVSWQFWIARQMLSGVPLYTHIMEINPPLWFWMALPLQMLGQISGVAPDRLYIAIIVLMSAWSTLISGRLLHSDDARRRMFLMSAIVILCLLVPINDFGQREQIAAILAIPYCALLVKRMRGEPVPIGFALAIGSTAAVGFALKHYFILVPVALELWLLYNTWHLKKLFRVETITLGLLAFVYAWAIVFFTPDFFRLIVPIVNTAYQGYEKPLINQILRAEVLIWFLASVAYLRIRRALPDRDRTIGDALTITAIAFAASYFFQQKGWQYHAIPGTIFATILMVHCLTTQRDVIQTAARYPIAVVAIMFFISIGYNRGAYENEWTKSMARLLGNEKAGDSVMIISVDPRRIFPFVEDYKLLWSSRHFAHWMLLAIGRAELKYGDAKMTPNLVKLSKDIRQQALADIKCNPPVLLLSQIRNRSGEIINPERFRVTDFFRRDFGFRDYLATNYRLVNTDKWFESYRRVTPIKVEGTQCYKISTA